MIQGQTKLKHRNHGRCLARSRLRMCQATVEASGNIVTSERLDSAPRR